jgi:UDP-N-acetylmuramoylalanine--D-glutamate ligase
VLGDIELFALAARAPVLGVTGSNGKSTVTTLAARMLEAQGLRAPAGGNLGPPALDLLAVPADAYVLEISSFQMETTHSLAPLAAAVLNVSPDHLDRHGNLERYAQLKEQLLLTAQHAVYSADDPLVAAMGARHAHAVPFSVTNELAQGYSVIARGGERWLARDGEALLATAQLAVRGTHNEANALAALALTAQLTVDIEPALQVLRTFTGLAHRCQHVAERAGVTFIDDSKGTNVGATLAALQGLSGPLVLIAGGLSKGQDLAPLAAAGRGTLRAAVLIGEAAAEIEALLQSVCSTARAASMDEAMWAAEAARTAQEIHGVKENTPAMMRDGFEALNVDEARLAELGLAGFTVAVANTCANHGGPGLGAIQQWNAKTQTWSVITDYMEADREVVDALIEEDSAAYAKENNITPRECN